LSSKKPDNREEDTLPVRFKCKDCKRKYYTANSPRHVKKKELCQECGGELEIIWNGLCENIRENKKSEKSKQEVME